MPSGIYERKLIPLKDRIARKICIGDPFMCWPWSGAVDRDGYGQIGRGRRQDGLIIVHRAIWEIHRGPIPTGMHVLHKCDNPPCCNPDHLFIGNNDDNIADKIMKGRQPRGENMPLAKLTWAKVAEIRAIVGLTQEVIAKRYNISQSIISTVLSNKAWVN